MICYMLWLSKMKTHLSSNKLGDFVKQIAPFDLAFARNPLSI